MFSGRGQELMKLRKDTIRNNRVFEEKLPEKMMDDVELQTLIHIFASFWHKRMNDTFTDGEKDGYVLTILCRKILGANFSRIAISRKKKKF